MTERSRLAIAIRYLLTYLLACVVGMLLYAGLCGEWDILLYMLLFPVFFPFGNLVYWRGLEIDILNPLQAAMAYSPYTIIAVLGIWTKRTVFFALFVGLLLGNIGGCVAAGIERGKQDRDSNIGSNRTTESHANTFPSGS